MIYQSIPFRTIFFNHALTHVISCVLLLISLSTGPTGKWRLNPSNPSSNLFSVMDGLEQYRQAVRLCAPMKESRIAALLTRHSFLY